jgi:exopolysaccharide biosynthesis polyprenyl glycosylphosphotransferase
MNTRRQQFIYIFSDFVAAAVGWFLFFNFRKHIVEAAKHGYDIPVNNDIKLTIGLLILPIFWIGIYIFSGYYKNIFRRSRLREIQYTITATFFGVLILFFALILDDSVKTYRDYYFSAGFLFIVHFIPTLLGRLIISTRTINKIQKRIWGYKTLLVGNGENANKLYNELENAKKSEGFKFIGYLSGSDANLSVNGLKLLGNWSDLSAVVRENEVEDVILCMDDKDHDKVPQMVDMVQNEQVHLKIMPDSYGMVMGMVKMNNILGAMLVEADFEVMPQWQKSAKRIFDVLLSTIALMLSFPIFLLLAILIKTDNPGPVFYKQIRVGYLGKPFNIFKFRSMRTDAETQGPQLSRENDNRITKMGKFLRKTRLDELPQFFNVLIGDMSIVGPRPERQFFIDQIVKKAPYYQRLHRIKPGITSWGQVKFGYAENVDQMVERMKYDILYLENMSLGLDLKIMIYTALIMVQGRGK